MDSIQEKQSKAQAQGITHRTCSYCGESKPFADLVPYQPALYGARMFCLACDALLYDRGTQGAHQEAAQEQQEPPQEPPHKELTQQIPLGF